MMEYYTREVLLREINTIGMGTFVKYYKYFTNVVYSRQEIISIMRNNEVYKETSLNTKVSMGIKIVKEKKIQAVLKIIIDAKNVDELTRNQAKLLLNKISCP
jgi:hypothetical protein